MKKLVLAVLALSLLLAGCTGGSASNTFVYGNDADIVNIAPILLTNTVSSVVSYQIHEPLVKYEGNYELKPALATEWSTSEDGLTWTFRLRPDVKWHDGEAFTSEDVKYTYELMLDPATKSLRRQNFLIIDEIDASDPLTVVFHLNEPHGPFLDKMTQIPIMAAHHTPGVGLENYNMNPMGTGPFKFKEWVPDDHVTLVANEDYWGGKPEIETLVFKPIPEPSVRAMALSKGEIDYANNLTSEDFANLQQSKKVQAFSIPQLRFAYLGQNNRYWLFQDKKVRQAMAYAVDKQTIIDDVYKGAARPSVGPYAAINEAWHNPSVKSFDYNPDLSRQLLAEAGWTPGTDGVLVNSKGQRFSFSVLIATGDQLMNNQAVLLQRWLSEVGIEMKLEFLDRAVMYDRLDARDYEAMMLSMGTTPEPDQYNSWHSSAIDNGFNDWCYSNPQVDRLLEQGRRESDPAVRKQIYDQVQGILAEDVAAIWLYHPNTLSALNSNFSGMTEEPAGQYQYLYSLKAR